MIATLAKKLDVTEGRSRNETPGAPGWRCQLMEAGHCADPLCSGA